MGKQARAFQNLLVITTCGSSILQHAGDETDRRWLTLHANSQRLEGEHYERLERLSRFARELLAREPLERLRELSAEINGIEAVRERWHANALQHVLIHTETAIGTRCAELLRDWLERRDQHSVHLQSATGLRTDSREDFAAAVSDLTKWLVDYDFDAYRKKGWRVVFHLTGGFKALNAYLQALGSVLADRCVFLFEGSTELIEIPRLPLTLALEETVRAHLDLFRRLAAGYSLPISKIRDAPESLFLVVDNEATLSVWGEMVWNQVRDRVLGDELLPPLSSRIRVKESVRDTVRKLPRQRRVLANAALDEFAAYVDARVRLRAARKFTRLASPHNGVSTHELYAWSDQGAWRFFLHKEQGDVWVVDALEPHL